MIELSRVDSPIGILTLAVSGRGLHALHLGADGLEPFKEPTREVKRPPREIAEALEAYFGGALRAIDDVPVCAEGTPFQHRVWDALRTIPAGQTWTYGHLAHAIGHPTAVRAVGAANGRNPVAIVVPCHRVIAANGTLHGYGGGLDKKRWLLQHEGSWPKQFGVFGES
ncbi:MAG: methylated-DNA--[protein]-cysteine S-methyltransferase [Myxococcaceae bacterium]|nr:methylated-DNA--[protein]-cysteine S-methyltransferase [Myxococcaceae bacterium]